MNNLYLNRREMLMALGLLCTSAALAACGPTGAPPPAPAAAEPTATTAAAAASTAGKKYEGITLRMLTQAGADYEVPFRTWAEEFTG